MKRKNTLKLLLAPIALSALAFGVTEMKSEALSASADANVTLVELDEKAAIRTADPYGIRFIGSVNVALEQAKTMTIGADVSFTYNGTDYSTEVTADSEKLYEQTTDDGNTYFNIALVDLENDAFNVNFSVQAWVKETAESKKVYSSTTATRSIAYVAGRAKAAGEKAEILDTIINTASEGFTLSANELAMKTGQTKTVEVSGTEVDVVTYEIEDTSVATVDAAGNVTAIKTGSTKLTVTIGNNERDCNISVSEPTATPLDLTSASGLTLGGYELTVDDNFVVSDVLALPALFGAIPEGKEIVAYKQVIGETITPLTATENENELKGVQAGESTQFRFETADGDYYYADVPVYTLVIESKDDLLNMTRILEANKADNGTDDDGNKLYSSGGYFVLGGNVKYATNFCNRFEIANVASDKHGFTGVFDGRGYTISGIRLRRGVKSSDKSNENLSLSRGLFGSLTSSAVVKNVNFDDVCAADNEATNTGILGYFVNGTVSNISLTFTNTSSQGLRSYSGTLAHQIGASAKLNNIVVQIKDITYTGTNAGWLASICNASATASHVYVINTTEKSFDYTYAKNKTQAGNFSKILGETCAYFQGYTDSEGDEVTAIEAFKNGMKTTIDNKTATQSSFTVDKTAFDSEYWDWSDDVPVVYHKEA